ncbi:MAG: hypothetical protein ACRD3J_13830, partial [Thermoanaerobaculia bacterium]
GSPAAYDAKDQLFDDPMTDPQSGWGTGTTGGGIASFKTDHLQLDPAQNGSWLWSRRKTGTNSGTMAVVGELTPSSDGVFGMLCDSGDTTLVGGLVDTTGKWYVISIDSSGVTVLSHSDAGAVSVPVGQTTLIAVECAGMSTGKLRVELWIAGQGLVTAYEQSQGPQDFDAAAVYGESSSAGFSLSLTHAQAFGVANLNGEPSAAAQDLLLNHVPHDWSSSCFEAVVPTAYGSWADTIVTCFLGKAGRVGAEVAEYEQYDDADLMNGDYQARVAGFPADGFVDSCDQGATESTWSYGGQEADAGRINCAPQAVGIRYDWTENQLNILSTLVDFDGSYADTWSDWLKAGPN